MSARHYPSVIDRIEAKLAAPDENGCRLWLGGRLKGYGSIKHEGKTAIMHRTLFIVTHGYAPPEVRHTCDVQLCGEITHLVAGTHKENMEDCARRRRSRSPRPTNGGGDRLGSLKRNQIRALWSTGNFNKSELARQFGVTPSRVRQIVIGK